MLSCTDMLAEGLNLHQAAIIINYDLPWNPQTLAQRVGRIDRLGSTHDKVACHTVLPDTGLNVLLRLLDRLRSKTSIAAATVGVSSQLFPGSPVQPRDFVSAVEQLQNSPKPPRPALLADQQRALLGEALRIPRVAAALDSMTTGTGSLAHPPRPGQGVLACFQVSTARRTQAAIRHVLTAPHQGLIHTDHRRCLHDSGIDPLPWLTRVQRGAEPLGERQPIPRAVLDQLWPLLERARHDVAAQFQIPEQHVEHRVRLLTWIALDH